MGVRVGTSGYAYKERVGTFYAERVTLGDMLSLYGAHIDTVEINNAFYRVPERDVVRGWRRQVPGSFRFVLKFIGRITHKKRSKDVVDEVGDLVLVSERDDTGGPALFQRRPYLRKHAERLRESLAVLRDKHELECAGPALAQSFAERRSLTA